MGSSAGPNQAGLKGNLTRRGMSLGVNRPLSSSFWGVALAPSPCKPQCWRILLKTCETQEGVLLHPVEPAARTLDLQSGMGDLEAALESFEYGPVFPRNQLRECQDTGLEWKH